MPIGKTMLHKLMLWTFQIDIQVDHTEMSWWKTLEIVSFYSLLNTSKNKTKWYFYTYAVAISIGILLNGIKFKHSLISSTQVQTNGYPLNKSQN